ncbi:glycosyltransferase family 2 protein [Advenella sp. S44]|uniref:glycosyltransferase n=1 Tax=Advenella sp. S44 TaxID=1982755 RepID=UPI00137482AD|nr:glycosyltransferase family 2 protein [Advenella sp. S44]
MITTEDGVQLNDHCGYVAQLANCPLSYVIAIPAKNEQATIVACLDACWQSMQLAVGTGKILLVINNTTDTTQALAAAWASQTGCPLEIVNITVAAHACEAGYVRRMAMQWAALSVRPDGVLLCTDADSRPHIDWVSANLAQIAAGYDLVCGDILLDQSHPQYQQICAIHRKNALEGQYRQASLELIHQLDPDPDNVWPHHNQVSGASLAIRRQVHDEVGGVPAVPLAEDRALALRVALHDYRICYCDRARVVTSCRMDGRAQGGMAQALRIRAGNEDFLIDESLEPADLVLLRAGTRATARRALQQGRSRHDLYAFLKIEPSRYETLDKIRRFGMLWQQLELHAYCLRPQRVLYSQLPVQLKKIEAMLMHMSEFDMS